MKNVQVFKFVVEWIMSYVLCVIMMQYVRKSIWFTPHERKPHKKRKDSLETRAVFFVFLLELELSGVVVQEIHQPKLGPQYFARDVFLEIRFCVILKGIRMFLALALPESRRGPWKWLHAVKIFFVKMTRSCFSYFSSYCYSANASKAVEKIAADEKDYQKCSLCFIVCAATLYQ